MVKGIRSFGDLALRLAGRTDLREIVLEIDLRHVSPASHAELWEEIEKTALAHVLRSELDCELYEGAPTEEPNSRRYSILVVIYNKREAESLPAFGESVGTRISAVKVPDRPGQGLTGPVGCKVTSIRR